MSILNKIKKKLAKPEKADTIQPEEVVLPIAKEAAKNAAKEVAEAAAKEAAKAAKAAANAAKEAVKKAAEAAEAAKAAAKEAEVVAETAKTAAKEAAKEAATSIVEEAKKRLEEKRRAKKPKSEKKEEAAKAVEKRKTKIKTKEAEATNIRTACINNVMTTVRRHTRDTSTKRYHNGKLYDIKIMYSQAYPTGRVFDEKPSRSVDEIMIGWIEEGKELMYIRCKDDGKYYEVQAPVSVAEIKPEVEQQKSSIEELEVYT